MPNFTDFKAELEFKKQLTEDVFHLRFKLIEPNKIEFRAGQYVMISVPQSDKEINRSYSICSSPKQGSSLDLCMNYLPNGPGSEFFKNLQVGDPAKLKGPFGFFMVNEQEKELGDELIFVATGTGVVPVFSMITDLLDTGFDKPLRLIFGRRSQGDIFFQNELEELANNYPNFSFTLTLSQPTPGWDGISGRVTEQVENMENIVNKHFYLCGNQEMIKDVSNVVMLKGGTPDQIHREAFY